MSVPPFRPTRYPIPCRPPHWARSGHAQTIWSHLIPSSGARIAEPRWQRLELPLADGDRLVLFTRTGNTGVRVHLFHGLSGDVNADYMRRTARALSARGHAVWAVNHRGCGAGRGRARQPYHSGRSEDMQAVLHASRAEDPTGVHLVIGFSLSGNIALLYGAEKRLPTLQGTIAVNPPIDLLHATLAMNQGLNRLYQRRFILRLRRAVRWRSRQGWNARDYDLPANLTMLAFDDLFTATECGFLDGRDYYARASTVERLREIATPTVILTAADDPFVDSRVIERAARSPFVALHVEPTGGHVGFLNRRGFLWGRWLDEALAHYVEQIVALP